MPDGEDARSLRVGAAFARLAPDPVQAADALARFRAQMATPPRAYHTERHIDAVLAQILAATDDPPSRPLLAAALYHDAVYDARRPDNELQSAVFCHAELTSFGVPITDILLACALILATQWHQPPPGDRDAVLLVDADLAILGSAPDDYAAYVAAIRAEYAHVADPDWRTGRRAVLERFLARPRLYWGDSPERDALEAQARENIAREIATLQ